VSASLKNPMAQKMIILLFITQVLTSTSAKSLNINQTLHFQQSDACLISPVANLPDLSNPLFLIDDFLQTVVNNVSFLAIPK
jgi:hypothetical protein